jgi:hypothetical protein
MVLQIKKNTNKTKIKPDILTVLKIPKFPRFGEISPKVRALINWLVRRGVAAYMYF